MPRRTVVGLFESKGDLKIDEAKLSARLKSKIEQLDAMILVLDRLKIDVESINKRGRGHRWFLLFSGCFAGVGLVVGGLGLLQGPLDYLSGAASLSAGLGIALVDVYLLGRVRRMSSVYHHKKTQVEDLQNDLDANLDRVYDEILAELYPPSPRRPVVARRPLRVKSDVVAARDPILDEIRVGQAEDSSSQ